MHRHHHNTLRPSLTVLLDNNGMVDTVSRDETASTEVSGLLLSLPEEVQQCRIGPALDVLVLVNMELAFVTERDITLVLLTRESEPLRIESQLP